MTYGYDDGSDDFATMGEEQFATVGYDHMGQAIVAPRGGGGRMTTAPGSSRYARNAPGPRLPPGGGGQQIGPSQRFALVPQGPALNEPRVRAIVLEELNQRLPSWFQGASRVPGSSDQAQLMSPLGLGVGTLTNAVNVVTLAAQPQRPFRGERLVVSALRTAGASVVPVRLSEFKIGENSQLVGQGALPVEAFAPDAFGVRLAMSPSAPGIVINLRFETDVAAVPAGESVTIIAAIIGRAVWGESGGPG